MVVIEAENYSSKAAKGSTDWVLDTQYSGYSGIGCMYAGPDSGRSVDTGYSTTCPVLNYEVDFSSAGTYYVWVRGYGIDGNSDSLHIGIDGQETASSDKISLQQGSYAWKRNTMDGINASISVPTSGKHTINVWMREDGARIDKIILTSNSSYVPSGAGQSETLKGLETSYVYNNAGNLTRITDALLNETNYTYDKAGNRTSMENGRHKTTTYQYGDCGILQAVIIPEAEQNTTTYKYDLGANIADMKDRNGNDTYYTYDNMNKVLSKSVTVDGTTTSVSYTYDEVGNRASMTDTTGTLIYEYDDANRLAYIRKSGTAQLHYTYDDAGNVLTVTDKKGYTTTYTYDNMNRMETVVYAVNGVSKTTTYEYDENGNRQAIIYQTGGVREEYTYDRNNHLLTLINKKGDGTVLSSYAYTYDIAGRQTTKTDSYGTSTYSYDELSRIKMVQTPGKTSIYHYDAAGNRDTLDETYTSSQSSGYVDESTGNTVNYIRKTSVYIYSGSNRLMQLNETMRDINDNEMLARAVNYLYDANGNMLGSDSEYTVPSDGTLQQSTGITVGMDETERIIDSVVDTENNEYDGFNRLIRTETIRSGNSTIVEYTYNGDDLRVKKVVKKSTDSYTPVETNYQYSGQHVILETDSADNLKVRYIRGLNYIARVDANNQLSNVLYNGHGDVVQTVSESGNIENQYDYDIFGTPSLTVEKGAETGYYAYSMAVRYAGEFLDVETGLYYLRARYYDPGIARFISEDSYLGDYTKPLSLNLYTYCYNEPIMNFDPSGHAVTEWDKQNLNAAQIAIIAVATIAWNIANKAGNQQAKEAAHALAVAARSPSMSTNQYVDDRGYVQTNSSSSTPSSSNNNNTPSGSGGSGGGNTSSTPKTGNGNKAKEIPVVKPETLPATVSYKSYALGVGSPYNNTDDNIVVQRAMMLNGITDANGNVLKDDGIFGNKTREAVANYQASRHNYGSSIMVDGIAGRQTLEELGLRINPYSDAPARSDDRLYELLRDDKNWRRAYEIIGQETTSQQGDSKKFVVINGNQGSGKPQDNLIQYDPSRYSPIQCLRATPKDLKAKKSTAEIATKTPVLSTINDVKILISGKDLWGYTKEKGERQRSAESLAFEGVVSAITGGAGGTLFKSGAKYADDAIEVAGDATKLADDTIEVVDDAAKETISSIKTPYGDAVQSTSKEALELKQSIDNGGQLYRGGTFGRSNTADAQFWAPESPLNPGYAEKYGVDFPKIDYIIGGKQIPGSPFITRPAPSLGNNAGGGLEIVNNPNSVKLDFFYMPE